MDKNLSALKPALVWKHFAQIVRIPRPSSHEEKIRKYVMDFAKSRGLECKEDAAHNVYVRKPASKGMEDRKGVILQAHLDMVPQKNNDKKFDFTKDPIDAYVDGEWVTADGTTLGADNGIGAAAILAVLEDDTLVHGPLEALFTATEETGMDGAFGLKKGLLRGDILLNLDSETEGELYVGCAGGLDANVTFKYTAEKTPARNYTAAKITVKGLKGGHSGIQIGCQRANANKVLFRFLNAASASCDVLLCSVDGGGLRNAIPREAEAVVMVKTKEYEAFAKELKAYEKVVRAEYAGIEDAVSVKIRECEAPAEMVAREVAEKLTKAVVGCPDEVLLAVVAVGTGNDWVRTFGISNRYQDAVKAISEGYSFLQDVGVVSYEESHYRQSRYMANVAGAGFDAHVVRKFSHLKKKGRKNRWIYTWCLVRQFFRYKSTGMKVWVDDRLVYNNLLLSIAIGICKYNGGGMQQLPEAVADDGMLDVSLIRPVHFWHLLFRFHYLFNGGIYRIRHILQERGSRIRIESSPEISVEVDGELLGETPLEFSILHKAIRIVVSKEFYDKRPETSCSCTVPEV